MKQGLHAEEIATYIEENLDKDLTLEEIAQEFHYSKSYIARIFSKEEGCTIYQYIKKQRLNKAAQKLAETDEAIIDIAYEAHYGSQQAFTLAFRQVYFVAPQVYRRNYALLQNQAAFMPSIMAFYNRVQAFQRRLSA